MLSHNIPSKQANKDHEEEKGLQTSGGGGGGSGGGGGRKTLKPPEQTLRCPRCDSPNTKFCYYNNYSLTQPRHFCKACRRYWTKGGALRNVPIGGSCRKNKKTSKSCSSSRFLLGESSSSFNSRDNSFYGLSTMDFHLGGFPPTTTITPRVTTTNQYSSSSSSYVNLDPLGFNFPISSSPHFVIKQGDHHHHLNNNQSGGGLSSFHEMGTSINHLHLHHNNNSSNNNNNDLASSIESLSSINQDLHWKLQQQRLSMMFSGGGEMDQEHHKKQDVLEPQVQRLQPILFQNLDTSKPTQSSMDGDPRKDSGGGGGGLATEWFFDTANLNPNLNPNPGTPTNSNDQNGSINNWNGIQTWNHLNHYSSIP